MLLPLPPGATKAPRSARRSDARFRQLITTVSAARCSLPRQPAATDFARSSVAHYAFRRRCRVACFSPRSRRCRRRCQRCFPPRQQAPLPRFHRQSVVSTRCRCAQPPRALPLRRHGANITSPLADVSAAPSMLPMLPDSAMMLLPASAGGRAQALRAATERLFPADARYDVAAASRDDAGSISRVRHFSSALRCAR